MWLSGNSYNAGSSNPNWKGGDTHLPQVACDTCGTIFTTTYWQEKRPHHFCKPRCYQDWRKTQTRENNPHWAGGLIDKVCPICQNTFSVSPSTKDKRKYCSKKCKALSQMDGNHDCHYSHGWVDRVKIQVKERDGHICQLCGSDLKLIIHHKDNRKSNHCIDNLVTWCRPCHCRYHNYCRLPKET